MLIARVESCSVPVLEHHADRVREALRVLGKEATPSQVAKYWVEIIDGSKNRD